MIGLEVHVQLKTASKMFCRCSNEGENAPPNTTICPVCLGHPGTLPVMNEKAVRWSARTALVLHCTINEWSKFDRKNYFYPDLPKGYQISQFDKPIGVGGYLDITVPDAPEGSRKEARIRLNRLHLEEDAAKLMHAPESQASLVDFNRSSTPLMEIVSEPDITSPLEAKIYLQDLRLLVRYLDVSHADMEKGHLRCDANVSIHFEHDGKKVSSPISEIKNLNSFRAVEKALEYEGNRLYKEWLDGGNVCTRTHKITVGWDDEHQRTLLQRSKEEAHDYRYFPEPDLPPIHFTEQLINEIQSEIPEIPSARKTRFQKQYLLSDKDARILIEDKELGNFFEKGASELEEWLNSTGSKAEELSEKSYKILAGLVINKLPALLEERSETLSSTKLDPENMGELACILVQGKINSTTGLAVLSHMLETGLSPTAIIKEKNLEQISDTGALETACDAALAANPDAIANFKAGKTTVIMFLVGQVMKEMKGKAQPDLVKGILENKLQQ